MFPYAFFGILTIKGNSQDMVILPSIPKSIVAFCEIAGLHNKELAGLFLIQIYNRIPGLGGVLRVLFTQLKVKSRRAIRGSRLQNVLK